MCVKIECANSFRRRKLGVSREQYLDMLERQNYSCAICGRHASEFTQELMVDHDHISGNYRGILCVNCNFVLGHAKDSIGILEKSIAYLREYS
jgi:hypothetical protein